MTRLPLEQPIPTPRSRKTMSRDDLLGAIYRSCPVLTRIQAKELLETTLGEITTALVRGEMVKLQGFGLFSVRAKRAGLGRNPQTGAEAPITARRVLTFKPAPTLVTSVTHCLLAKQPCVNDSNPRPLHPRDRNERTVAPEQD